MIVASTHILQTERAKRGLTKTDLANKIGVSHSVIVRVEQGKGISPRNAKMICDYLGIPFDTVFMVVEKEGNVEIFQGTGEAQRRGDKNS